MIAKKRFVLMKGEGGGDGGGGDSDATGLGWSSPESAPDTPSVQSVNQETADKAAAQQASDQQTADRLGMSLDSYRETAYKEGEAPAMMPGTSETSGEIGSWSLWNEAKYQAGEMVSDIKNKADRLGIVPGLKPQDIFNREEANPALRDKRMLAFQETVGDVAKMAMPAQVSMAIAAAKALNGDAPMGQTFGSIVGGLSKVPMGGAIGSMLGGYVEKGDTPSAGDIGSMLGGYFAGNAGAKAGWGIAGNAGAAVGGWAGSKAGKAVGGAAATKAAESMTGGDWGKTFGVTPSGKSTATGGTW
jgi:hypothetical protein